MRLWDRATCHTLLGNLYAIPLNLDPFLMFLALCFSLAVVDIKKALALGRETQGTIGESMDIVSIGVGLLFFALSWGFIVLCEHL